MADEGQADAWRHRLREIKLRLQRAESLSLSELEGLRSQQREIECLIRSFQR